MRLVFGLLGLLVFITADAESEDLSVLGIDGIGANKLDQIKNMNGIDWWLEMGDKLLVAPSGNVLSELPADVTHEYTIKNVKISDLAVHILGHCDHSETDEILHDNLNVVFAGQTVRIVDIGHLADKSQLLKHDSIIPFETNRVLTYQLKNRAFISREVSSDTQELVDQVDKDRWYSQVEYLAGFDRMEEADLDTTGDWLENKFTELGFTTSRITLHNHYRGTNVLGFKQGTTRPDEWYVVGAHMDSRNSNWNDALPSPGAEDNASGCSGVLEIANVISQYDTEASIYFMCFIEEESGLLGSQDVVTHFSNNGDLSKVKTMLNLDMISYRGPNRNDAIVGTRNNWHPNLANTVAANGAQYTDIDDWQVNLFMCCTDFVSFANANVPAVTTNQPDISSYAGYHTTQDFASNLDPDLGAGIVKANLVTLIDLVGVDFNSNDLIFADGFGKPD
jgi:hypothetical protein